MPHHLFWTPEDEPKMNGPFRTARALVLGLAERSRKNWALNQRYSYKPEFFERHLSRALEDSSPTFSHTDLQRKNVIVREIVCEGTAGKDYEVVVVDWEDAGWYPAYWEYAVAFGGFFWFDDDWPRAIESVLDPYGAEATMLNMIKEDLWM